MNMRLRLSCFVCIVLSFCSAQKKTDSNKVDSEFPIAFPGAEGYGKYTTGGRGGKIYIVSNLNDDGPGSFRQAAESKEPRIIVFAVSGTIHLEDKISIRGNATIAGQTAPGDGICIADQPVGLSGDNIIVRYLRFRMGDRYQNKGKVPGSGHDDAFGGSRRKNIIIDHCSISWSTDECISIYGGDSTTLQWNIISEPLNYSYHFEEGDTDFENHGYGGIWGGVHFTAHHNLFAHCNSRNPRFNGTRLGAQQEFADFRNNVIYNWGSNNIYGGEAGLYNIINNYYKYGPSTHKKVRFRIVNPSKTNTLPYGKWFVEGNHVDGAKDVSKNNWLGIDMGNNGTDLDKRNTIVSKAFPAEETDLQTASDAYESVLKYGGASFRRDTLDARIINDVKNRTGSLIDVQGGFPHGTSFDQTINAWPTLMKSVASLDTDKDGIPDDWEKRNGLNPSDPSDAAIMSLHKNYSNIEVYINSITK
ncbi:MAG: pectate lyase [Chitinophagaceae bacterium]|nr:pectate lyase [Chitinophagaceae bacterium]